MLYRRIENAGAYRRITEVLPDGTYTQKSVWPDGVITDSVKTTVQKMGWPSVKEFLKARPHFKKED